jgi:hypothetical protein
MMEQRWRQLNLLALIPGVSRHQKLDPLVRVEVTGLIKLLLNECSAALAAKAPEANDE